jgi:hypothetical protein
VKCEYHDNTVDDFFYLLITYVKMVWICVFARNYKGISFTNLCHTYRAKGKISPKILNEILQSQFCLNSLDGINYCTNLVEPIPYSSVLVAPHIISQIILKGITAALPTTTWFRPL